MFSHFTDEQVARLAKCATVVQHPADALVVKEGERSRGIYLLVSGNVRIQRKTPYGLFALASLDPGSLFGETSFVDRGPRTGDAITTTADTELVAFDADALDAASQADPRLHLALSWLFWKSLSTKLRQTNENLTSFFQETGRPAVSEPITHFQAGGDLYIDMATKRKLFEDMKLSN